MTIDYWLILELLIYFIIAFIAGELFSKIKLPKLLGYLLVGIVVGNLYTVFDQQLNIKNYVTDITGFALSVILLKAGLGISKKTLKSVGKRAVLLGVIPNLLEGFTITFLAYFLLNLSFPTAGMLGFIISAVSPAVIIPSMTKIKEERYGVEKGLPTMNLASASLDDVISLTLFSVFFSMSQSENLSFSQFIIEPLMVINGIIVGIFFAFIFSNIFKYTKNKYIRVLEFVIMFAVVYTLTKLGHDIYITSSICIMVLGFLFADAKPEIAKYFAKFTSLLWIVLQVFLFFTVGAMVQLNQLALIGIIPILIIIIGLSIRFTSSYACLYKSKFNKEEKLFNSFANIPKATVQAVLGAVPLAYGIKNGELILSMAVFAIILTAPTGLLIIEKTYKKLLQQKRG